MLDQPLETDSELKPKRTAALRGVEESVRHLSHEDLEAYVHGRLPPARLNQCSAHLDSCLACQAELEDLRTLESEASAFAHPQPLGRELERRRKRRSITLVQTATIAIIFVAVASTAIWWGRDRLSAKKPPVVATVAQTAPPPLATVAQTAPPPLATVTQIAPPPLATVPSAASSPPVATVQPRNTRPAGQVAAPLASAKPGVAPSIQHGTSQPPADVSRTREPAPAPTGAPQSNEGFALLSPFGEAIADARPEFHWTPLAGAVRYSVAIVDERLHPVQHSHALRTTSWRPRRPLRRGHTYLWQVTATLRHGSTVVASGPSSSGALLRISPK